MGLAGDRLCVMKQQSLFTISHNNTHSYIIIIHLWSALSDILPNLLIHTLVTLRVSEVFQTTIDKWQSQEKMEMLLF